jgi:hypothetical protein
MKVTRKRESLEKALAEPADGKDSEIAPSLFLRGLPKPIDGLDGGKEFEGHIKGKCRGHSTEDRGGKEEHSYDLDVHHFEPGEKGKEVKQKKSSREQVDEAFKKYDEEDKAKAAKKEAK